MPGRCGARRCAEPLATTHRIPPERPGGEHRGQLLPPGIRLSVQHEQQLRSVLVHRRAPNRSNPRDRNSLTEVTGQRERAGSGKAVKGYMDGIRNLCCRHSTEPPAPVGQTLQGLLP